MDGRCRAQLYVEIHVLNDSDLLEFAQVKNLGIPPVMKTNVGRKEDKELAPRTRLEAFLTNIDNWLSMETQKSSGNKVFNDCFQRS
jgi:hypothetical protein